mmetsp:Transcript_15751/g.34493  ORF Transcript_15751/g.34493 Transcript_15751/m.34493 type:complete len:195 (-) Transcript_15751:2422-3006(-)
MLSLAVKRSNQAPSQWVHSDESLVGREVHLQVGGSCVLDTAQLDKQPVTFFAGGIGISPLLSMYRFWVGLQVERAGEDSSIPPSSFLYSVSDENELVFLGELVGAYEKLIGACSDPSDHSLILTTTQQERDVKQALHGKRVTWRNGRQLKAFIDDAPRNSAFYLCGPPSMLDEGSQLLEKKSVDDSDIHMERWW